MAEEATNNHLLTEQTAVKMADLASTRARIGILPYSESTIRRLIERGQFPPPKQLPYSRGVFWLYGEVNNWLKEHNAKAQAVQ